MKVAIIDSSVGVFALNEDYKVIDFIIFPKDALKIAENLKRLINRKPIDELMLLIKNLMTKGYTQFVFEKKEIAEYFQEKLGIKYSIETPNQARDTFLSNTSEIIMSTGQFADLEEFYNLLHDVMIKLAKAGVEEASSKRDLLLSQAILALDDLDKSLNIFANRLREWYGLHFPELNNLIEKNDLFLALISSLTDRENFTIENLLKRGIDLEKAKIISGLAETSMGAKIKARDLDEVSALATTINELYNSRNRIERYLDEIVKEVTPNIYNLVGPTLGARLIVAAGGLKNLAKKSAGTIQVFGAERALFRSLRTGTKPPKHGLIFQHKEIHQSPRQYRGKIARILASKLAIAARLDAYDGKFRGTKLKNDFEERVREILENELKTS